jgi:GAF domain-containing protein
MPPTAASDLTSALYEVLDATIEMQGADFGNVQLYEESSETLNIVAHRGLDQKFLDYFAIVDVRETSACGLALRSGTRITIEDVNTDPDFEPQLGIAASTGIRALQSTPLIDRHSGKPLGMLSTHFRQPYRRPARELRLTDLFARQAADLIAFRVLEQRTRDSEARLSAIVAQFPGAFGLFDAEGRLLLRGGALSTLWTDITPSQEAELARQQSGGGVLIDTRVGVGTSVKVFMPCVEVIGEDLEQELVDAAPESADEAEDGHSGRR